MSQPPTKSLKKFGFWIVGAFVCFLFCGLVDVLYFDRGISKSGYTHLWIPIVSSSLKAYLTEYGEMPTGTNAEIMAKLMGRNPRKIVFCDLKGPNRLNKNGELIDLWGTPYRFDTSDPKNPRVWSCGPNRNDEGGAEGSDDIVSWR
jgi:hypothetical protein